MGEQIVGSSVFAIDGVHPVWLVAGALVASFIPIMIGMLTAYLKISIVLGIIRNALGAGQIPGNLIVMVLSLALTFTIMTPVLSQMGEVSKSLSFEELLRKPSLEAFENIAPVAEPWRAFLNEHAGERELAVFLDVSSSEGLTEGLKEQAGTVIPFAVLIPAFLVTELKEAFAMAFVVLLPFLAVDLVVANLLAGMGMFMVSPVMISLPLKLILFVVSDAWLLLMHGLIQSYQ